MASYSPSVHVGELSPFLSAVTLIILVKNQHIMHNHKEHIQILFSFCARNIRCNFQEAVMKKIISHFYSFFFLFIIFAFMQKNFNSFLEIIYLYTLDFAVANSLWYGILCWFFTTTAHLSK